MPTRTAPKVASSTIIAAANMTVPAKLRQAITEVSMEFFERRDIAEIMVIANLARAHGILYGPPGAAKSALIRRICEIYEGARMFDMLMDKESGKTDLFGQIDSELYDQTGRYERDLEGTLADCHIGMLDELGKTRSGLANLTLTAINERLFKNGKTMVSIPLISLWGGSNEMMEPELAAFEDRFLVKRFVEYLQEPANFTAFLASKVKTRGGAPKVRTTITLDELLNAIENEVPYIPVPQRISDALLGLRAKLKNEGIVASDRRWGDCIPLLQASAWLNERDEVDEDDLRILADVLWRKPEDIGKVRTEVYSLTSEITRKAMAIEETLSEVNRELVSRKGESKAKLLSYAVDANFNLEKAGKELTALYTQAKKEKKNTNTLDTVGNEIKELQVRVYIDCMGMGGDGARAAVATKSEWDWS